MKRRSGSSPSHPRRRLRRSLAVGSACYLVIVVGVAMVTLPLSQKWFNVQQLQEAVRHAPSFTPVPESELYLDDRPAAGHPTRRPHRVAMPRSRAARLAFRCVSWCGHDHLGRSLLFRVLPAFLISLGVGLAAAAFALVVGGIWGSVAALAGGAVDLVMMRVVDVLYGLPYILTVIMLQIALSKPLTGWLGASAEANVVILFLAVSGVSWLTMSRVVRGQVLRIRNEPFVEASRIMGGGPVHIVRRHVLPNVLGPMLTCALLVVPQAVLQESFLSFLGIGIQPPVPSLGNLAAEGVEAVNGVVGYWWLLAFPCGVLVLTLLALNFVVGGLPSTGDAKGQATSCA